MSDQRTSEQEYTAICPLCGEGPSCHYEGECIAPKLLCTDCGQPMLHSEGPGWYCIDGDCIERKSAQVREWAQRHSAANARISPERRESRQQDTAMPAKATEPAEGDELSAGKRQRTSKPRVNCMRCGGNPCECPSALWLNDSRTAGQTIPEQPPSNPPCILGDLTAALTACTPYLKDGETPAECIARNRKDFDGCLTLLAKEKQLTESYAEQIVTLVLEAEQLDKRLKAVRNKFDPLNESGLFSTAAPAPSNQNLAAGTPAAAPRGSTADAREGSSTGVLTSNHRLLANDLRIAVKEMRRKPWPIADLIPLLLKAADALDGPADVASPGTTDGDNEAHGD